MTKGRPLYLLHTGWVDGRGEEDQQREVENNNFCYIYVNGGCDVLRFQPMKLFPPSVFPALPRRQMSGFQGALSEPSRTNHIQRGPTVSPFYIIHSSEELWGRGRGGQGVPEDCS